MADPSIPVAVEQLLGRGPASARQLAQALGLSQPSLSRVLRQLESQQRVVRIGSTRGAQYAVRRLVGDVGSSWPLYRIDAAGAAHEVGQLNAIERDSYFARSASPRLRGLFDGLPYYLQDARPGGFLGRAVPAAYPELRLPARVVDWTDAHVLTYLVRRGSENPGDLILGTEALDRYLAGTHGPPLVAAADRMHAYPALADAAMAGAPPGSSAHGEHPKFIVCIAEDDSRTHMLVKFSPPRTTAVGQRWADLLIAEHEAHRVLEEHGVHACVSRLIENGARLFLECERFDRVGLAGRRGVVSLFALDVSLYGRLDNWTASSQRLLQDSLLSPEDAARIRLLDTFGNLIANTDRHFGNITLFDTYEGPLELAPAYDMLPMLFAPQNDQIIERAFAPAPPTAASLPVWSEARALAETYWARLAQHERLSASFRELCARCLQVVQALPRQAARVDARKLVDRDR